MYSFVIMFLSVLQELVRGYEDRNIPLDVLVTDMDWHITFYKESSEGKKDQVSRTSMNVLS